MIRRIAAAIILLLLLVVPFLNWQAGLTLWLCAWIMFIVGKLFDRKSWNLGKPEDDEDGEDGE